MALLSSALPVIQVVLALLLIGGILLQQRGAGLGSAFGGDISETYYTRRGAEKLIFQGTIIVAILFVASIVFAFVR
jgi:preprotein translocase subunit SecG